MKLIIDVPEEFYETIKTTPSYRFNYLEEKVRQATPLQEELEEIKAEMKVIHDRYKINFQGYSMSVAQECIDIIDQRIAELKGENNGNS